MSSSLSNPQEQWHDTPQQPVPYINQAGNPYDSQTNHAPAEYAQAHYPQTGPYPDYYADPHANTSLFPFFPPFYGPFFPPFFGPFFPPFFGPYRRPFFGPRRPY